MKLFNFLSDSKPPLIAQSVNDLVAMVDRAAEMFAAATGVLIDNEALRVDLGEMDEDINTRERLIRRAVLEHVAVNPQHELSFSLVMVAVVQDAERCGDLAKSIAKAADLAASPRMGPHVGALADIRDRVQSLFPLVHAAFTSGDRDGARRVMEEHEVIKREVGEFLGDLATSAGGHGQPGARARHLGEDDRPSLQPPLQHHLRRRAAVRGPPALADLVRAFRPLASGAPRSLWRRQRPAFPHDDPDAHHTRFRPPAPRGAPRPQDGLRPDRRGRPRRRPVYACAAASRSGCAFSCSSA